MTKVITLITAVFIFCSTTKAQYVNIPDSNFRNYLKTNYPGCFNASDQMDTTCSAILEQDTLDFTPIDPFVFSVANLEGVQYFKSLRYLAFSDMWSATVATLPASLKTLICNGGYITDTLPPLPARLEYLYCSRGRLRSLPPVLPGGLIHFDCSDNGLITSLPVLPASLKELSCGGNNISLLPSSLPAGLEKLSCPQNNSISVIPDLPASLITLVCGNNTLTSLPALPALLKTLECESNNISSLPAIPGDLIILHCNGNNLTSLPALPNKLTELICDGNPLGDYFSNRTLPDSLTIFYCSGTQLTGLPATLPAGLQNLGCAANQLTALPPLPPGLRSLNCYHNQITSLPELPQNLGDLNCEQNNIYCLPRLPDPSQNYLPMLMISFDADKIKCTPNHPQNVIFNGNDPEGGMTGDLPLCNPTNNANHCQAFPIISGTAYYDNNSNGVRDTNEPFKSNLGIDFSNGKIAYTNSNGYFEMGVDSLGVYSVTATAPSYFNVVPASEIYDFTSYDTIVSREYALQPNTSVDSFNIRITPINWAARPGFSFSYLITYVNAGTTTLSPDIIFNYDDTRLTYDSSSNTAVVNNTGSLSLAVGSFAPGQQESFVAYFRLDPAAVIGDSIAANTSITAGSYNVSDNNVTVIQGSFDPNDKQATPQLSPLQVANGEYIDYTIRFQNTGTDTAFNIVISDTLNADLRANTLQMISSSHNCKATVKDNIVFFEFINILLPDSNANEPKSHGFVSFRIKPQPTVAINTIIPNNAAIYFDYNAPVITNTAGTLIKDFTVVPLRLVSFSAIQQSDNTTTLYWNTTNEINTKHFVIEQSTDGTRFNSVSNIMAKGNVNNNYSASVADANNNLVYYRLKIVDNDGRFTHSPVLKVDRRKNTSGITVLTNPVKDFLIINTNNRDLNNTKGNIVNLQGATIKSFVIRTGTQTVEIKDVPAGIYYMQTIAGSSRIFVQ